MLTDLEVLEVMEKLHVLGNIFKTIRFVDPLYKKALIYENGTLIESQCNCFDFLGKNEACTNCISARALNTNETCVKIEYNKEEIAIVMSVPIEINNKRIVVELINDVTESMVVNGVIDANNYSKIHSLIDNINDLISLDPLTGLYNRRYLDEKLPVDIVDAILAEEPLSIIMVDIDFFKKINDEHGHLGGDFVLKRFATILLSSMKDRTGWISRYGGEEFLIIIPKADIETVKEIAEDIRKTVETTNIRYKEKRIKITSSFGVTSIKPTEKLSIESIIEDVDRKLYLAKRNGRNRIEF